MPALLLHCDNELRLSLLPELFDALAAAGESLAVAQASENIIRMVPLVSTYREGVCTAHAVQRKHVKYLLIHS